MQKHAVEPYISQFNSDHYSCFALQKQSKARIVI